MKNLIIISLNISLLFGLISCKPTARVTTAQLPQKPTITTPTQPVAKPDTNLPTDQATPDEKQTTTKNKAIEENQQKEYEPSKVLQQRTYEPKIPGGKVNWMSFEDAEKAMKEKPKKVFVKVYTQWCGWCKRLDKATFADKRVADYINENYYPVKFDAQHPDPVELGGKEYGNPNFDASKPKKARNAIHQLAQKYGARSYPTILFLDEKMDLMRAIPGYRDADAFIPILEQLNRM